MKPARHSARRRKPTPPPGGWSVVLIDGAPIRQKARRDYEKAMRELNRAKAEAERFENEDKPRFSRWMNANFGALLTETRELHEKLTNAEGLVREVQDEFFFGNYRSIHTAYQKVVKRRSEPEPAPEEEAPPQEESDEAEEAEFRRAFEDIFGKVEEEFWEKFGNERQKTPPNFRRESKARRPDDARLKDLYRKLVRKLHPDKGADRTVQEKEWWHQTQDAYESGNVEQLEVIWTLIEMQDRGCKDATVSALGQLTAEFKKSLRSLKRKLSSFKKDIAWNFSQLTDFGPLVERVRKQLQAERDEIVSLLRQYERQIKGWELSAEKSGKRAPRRRRGAWQDEEWF